MAKAKSNEASVREVDSDGALPVKEIVVEGDARGSDAWHREQAEALLNYKASGQVGCYADPTRDQEPDIAPELGVAPHPELFNPAPPKASFSGVASDHPVAALSVKEKEEALEEETEAFNEAMQAREEAAAEGEALPALPASEGVKASSPDSPAVD